MEAGVTQLNPLKSSAKKQLFKLFIGDRTANRHR